MSAEPASPLARRLLQPFPIPAITPFAFGVFRAIFGLGLLGILLLYQPTLAVRALDVREPHSSLADHTWVYTLAVNAFWMSLLHVVACVAALLFTVGVVARPAYVVAVALMFLNVLMILARQGAHDWDLPIVTLIALIVVPWGDAPNLVQLVRLRARFSAGRLATRAYGFAVWLPGLTVGLAFAAAAYAKLSLSGLRWITNGTVRYHFVEDGRNAPLTLGLWVAAHPSIAVALSFAAVLVEAAFILVVFARTWRVRLAYGLAGASMMAGFTLFQGVSWWPWRLLFLAFLPWTLLSSSAEATAALPGDALGRSIAPRRELGWVHAVVVIVLVGNQMRASVRGVEVEPFVSNFPMYAYTWSSPEDFEQHRSRIRYAVAGTDVSEQVETADGEDVLQQLAMPDQRGPADAVQVQADLRDFSARYRRMHGALPPAIDVVRVRQPFDWAHGRYLPQTRELVGTVRLSP